MQEERLESDNQIVDDLSKDLKDKSLSDNIEDATVVNEEVELTDEQKKELYIKQLKASRIKFHSVVHNGNITTNQFGSNYQKKRQKKNKISKNSRRSNRK